MPGEAEVVDGDGGECVILSIRRPSVILKAFRQCPGNKNPDRVEAPTLINTNGWEVVGRVRRR